MNEEIEMEEQRCFMRLLGEVEGRVKKGSRKGKERDEEEELGKMQVEKVLGRLKKGKAAGEYRITNEVWKFGREEIREWVWEFCNRI